MAPSLSSRSAFVLLLAFLSFLAPALAKETKAVKTTVDGKTVWLKDSRRPSLYTGDFGDCMGSSTVNVTRFDAAYYKDNMTVLFHLEGNTAVKNESLMIYIGVFAYGEARFDLTFNPCSANIKSLCPMKTGVPIEANGIIPISQQDVAGIPPIALSIPDFEGEAILRIFANSTQSEIGCFSAVLTNGKSFSQAASVGTILGIFTAVAMISSFATAVYGDHIPTMRKHYAHSLSVLVVFSTWHHIFFSGALSMNWPSVLVAFWSNYAWAGGMIHTKGMQNSINKFIGSNKGNTSVVGAAGVGVPNENLGGGYDIHAIYKRHVFPKALNVPGLMKRAKFNRVAHHLEDLVAKRELANKSDGGFAWYGKPLTHGLPLPGNYSGFAGTLGQEEIPASNAFMTGFLWFLILLAIVAGSVVAFKWILEGLTKTPLVRNDRLVFFRNHWLRYTALAVLRTLFIGFFMIMFLCLFQFTYLGSTGPIAIASIVFIAMLLGMFGAAGYACYYWIKFGNHTSNPEYRRIEKKKALKVIPWFGLTRSNESEEPEKSIHDDDEYTKKFGWLASRFRRTRWWFFVVWLTYEFVRACFLGGASGHAMVQVFGLLVVEFIAFVAIIIMRPFEGQRLNAIVVYILGFSKVATVALSAAFDISFNLARIPATVIGVVIIVIQGILTIVVMIAIVVGAISSYMSVMRNREEFKPKKWAGLRDRYFQHLDRAEKDVKIEPPPEPEVPEEPKAPYFSVNSIKRVAKIEDEDPDFVAEIHGEFSQSQMSLSGLGGTPEEGVHRRSRAPSIQSQVSMSNIPSGARVHRASWSSRDLSENSLPRRDRRYTAGSRTSTPMSPDTGTRTPSQPGLNSRYMANGENILRGASPLSSRPITPVMSPPILSPPIIDREGSPFARPRSRTSPPAHRYSRPQLTTVDSETDVLVPLQEKSAGPSTGNAL
jgi:hypothetical protein